VSLSPKSETKMAGIEELLDIGGRYLAFTFLVGRKPEVLAPDI
jgi:hypothetical protein